MLVISESARERFDEAKQHARSIGLGSQLAGQLRYLQHYATDVPGAPRCRVTLGYDFSPHSFSVLWERRDSPTGEWRSWFNGGLIFHGSHDHGGDGGAPTFSVNLTPHDGWSIHT